jgi:hypothetical protein
VSLAVNCVSFISVSYFGQMFQFFIFFVATVPAFAVVDRLSRAKSRPRSTQAQPALGTATAGATQ